MGALSPLIYDNSLTVTPTVAPMDPVSPPGTVRTSFVSWVILSDPAEVTFKFPWTVRVSKVFNLEIVSNCCWIGLFRLNRLVGSIIPLKLFTFGNLKFKTLACISNG